MQIVISKSSVIVSSKEVISREIDQEIGILNTESETPYVLDGVSASIWNLIQEPRTVNEVLDILLKEYEVEPSRCEKELVAFIHDLAKEGLIELKTVRTNVE